MKVDIKDVKLHIYAKKVRLQHVHKVNKHYKTVVLLFEILSLYYNSSMLICLRLWKLQTPFFQGQVFIITATKRKKEKKTRFLLTESGTKRMHKNDYHKYHQRAITNSDMILIYGNLKFLQRTEGVSILVLGSANPKADIIRNFRKQLASEGFGFIVSGYHHSCEGE